MKTKKTFSIFLVLAFLLTACGQGTATPAPVTQTPVATQPPTDIPTLTPLPTLVPLFQTLSPTTPYPTASVVKANAVAFISTDEHFNYSLWVANVDGSGERKLVDLDKNNDEWRSTHLIRWSPNGQWISYISGNDIWITSYDGSVKKNLLSFADKSIGNLLYTYIWAPDSSKIIFENIFSDESITPSPESSPIIGIVDVTTKKITTLPTHDSLISISPDNRHILLGRKSSFLLFDIKTDKSVEIKTEETLSWDYCTAVLYDEKTWSWSPNGQWFVYTGYHNYDNSPCVSNLDGTISYEITSDDVNGAFAVLPTWDKTSDYLYLVVGNYNDPSRPEMFHDLRIVRFNIKTKKIEQSQSLPEIEAQPFSISPDGHTLEFHSVTAENKLSFTVMDTQSSSINKFAISDAQINTSITSWSADSQNFIIKVTKLYTPYKAIADGCYNCFYSFSIKTGKVTVISGNHSIETWRVSPIAITP